MLEAPGYRGRYQSTHYQWKNNRGTINLLQVRRWGLLSCVGDCLMLPGDNAAYLRLLEGLNLDQAVTLDFIYALVARFTLVLPADDDWTADKASYKESMASELAEYDLGALYFCLQLN